MTLASHQSHVSSHAFDLDTARAIFSRTASSFSAAFIWNPVNSENWVFTWRVKGLKIGRGFEQPMFMEQ